MIKNLSKKWLMVSFGGILIIIIAYAVFRQYNPILGFKYFEPNYLPPNTSIKAKRISITFGRTSVEQNFRTEDWVYTIKENSADGQLNSIGTAKQNYDPKSIKPTCMIKKTPAQISYRLCHWVDYGRIDVHEVTFIKNRTRIYSQIPTQANQVISIDQIERFIDSFQSKSTLGFPILHTNGA